MKGLNKNYSTLHNLIYMTKEMMRLDKSLIIIVFLGAISAVGIDYTLLYLPKLVISDIINEVEWTQLLLTISIITMILFTFRMIDTWCSHHRAYRFKLIRMSMILKKVYKMNTMNYEYLENPDIMNLSQLAHNALSDYEGVQGLMNRVYYIFIDIVKMGIAITILLQVKLWLILIVFLLSFLHFIFFNKNIVKDKENTWNKLGPLFRKISYLNDANSDFSYGKDIRLQRMGNFLSKKQTDIHQEAHHYVFLSKRRWGYFGVFTNLTNSLLELLLYIILVYEFIEGRINIADFTLYVGTAYAFFSSLSGFLYGVAHTRRCSLYTNDYRSFMELQYRDKPVKRSIEDIKHFSFEFKQVSFKYPNQEAYALKDLSIKLDQGSKLAVVGLNGAGKTTFIKLLLRLYEPQSGEIYVDEININEFDRNEYYRLFAPLFQEVEVFAFPIAENVSLKSPSMTDRKKTLDSLCLAGFEERLKHLKKGIDTQILKIFDEDGIDLSGGEKQKLALARAIYKDAPVIVLDEPTSAMDALAEYQLYQDFNQIMKDKTAIYISHRLSSTRFCDNIALFKDGSLLEYGNHKELMEQDKEYRHLFDIQSLYYKEESADAK